MMKLSKLFVIAALVGGVAVIGCGDDEPVNGTGGTGGGTGGTGGGTGGGGGGGADPCTGEFCDDSSATNKGLCESLITFCNSDDCCELPGAGGAGGTMTIDPTPEECDTAGESLCSIDFSGAGGNGGAGGGGGECRPTDDVCVGGLCDTPTASKPLCRESYDGCVDLNNPCDSCEQLARTICGTDG